MRPPPERERPRSAGPTEKPPSGFEPLTPSLRVKSSVTRRVQDISSGIGNHANWTCDIARQMAHEWHNSRLTASSYDTYRTPLRRLLSSWSLRCAASLVSRRAVSQPYDLPSRRSSVTLTPETGSPQLFLAVAHGVLAPQEKIAGAPLFSYGRHGSIKNRHAALLPWVGDSPLANPRLCSTTHHIPTTMPLRDG